LYCIRDIDINFPNRFLEHPVHNIIVNEKYFLCFGRPLVLKKILF
jgi:hypothetical protein